MKKTYISPNFLLVELRSIQMLAQSVDINMMSGDGNQVNDVSGVLVKEQYPPISDKNVWDDEW